MPTRRTPRPLPPAKRGRGNKARTADVAQDATPSGRRAAMAGFCSCKTAVPAIVGRQARNAPAEQGWPAAPQHDRAQAEFRTRRIFVKTLANVHIF